MSEVIPPSPQQTPYAALAAFLNQTAQVVQQSRASLAGSGVALRSLDRVAANLRGLSSVMEDAS